MVRKESVESFLIRCLIALARREAQAELKLNQLDLDKVKEGFVLTHCYDEDTGIVTLRAMPKGSEFFQVPPLEEEQWRRTRETRLKDSETPRQTPLRDDATLAAMEVRQAMNRSLKDRLANRPLQPSIFSTRRESDFAP